MNEKNLFLNEMGIAEIIRLLKSERLDFEPNVFSFFLSTAIQKENDEIFNLVLQKYLEGKIKMDLNAPSQNGLNFLALSIMHNNFNYFKKLLLVGASPLEPVGRNIAKMNKKLRSVSALCDSLDMTPLSIAVDLNRIEMVKEFRSSISKKELIYQALRTVKSKEKEEMRSALLFECEEEIKSLLFQKIKENDFKQVLDLLRLKVLKSLDFQNEEGKTPLMCAVSSGSHETFVIIKEAQREGATSFDVNFVLNNTTALNDAILLKRPDFVKDLLFMGANPLENLGKISDKEGCKQFVQTPLFNLVRLLLKDKESYMQSLFYISCLLPEVTMASEAVKIAKFLKAPKVYKLLLKNSNDLSNMPVYSERMIKAVKEGDVDLVSFLMDRRVSVVDDFSGTSALYEAAKSDKTDILKIFIDLLPLKKLETGIQNVTPFMCAVWHNKERAALMLLNAGVEIPDKFLMGKNILETAVEFDMSELICEIVKRKSKLKNSLFLQKLLWKAISLKRNKSVRMFCNLDLDMTYKNVHGTNAFLLAVKKKNFEAVKLLQSRGMNINVLDDMKNSPLHYALLNGDEKTAFFLIEKGALLNTQNVLGQTPLMLAAEKGLSRIVAVLVEYRADALKKDKNGETAFAYYKKYKLKQAKRFVSLNAKVREI